MGSFLLIFLVLFPILGSFPVYPLRDYDRTWRNHYVRILPGVELLAALALLAFPSQVSLPGVCGLGLSFASGSLRTVLAVLAAFLWLETSLPCEVYFADAERVNRFCFFYLMTLGALMGVFLAGDLLTLFVFFEVMSFTSYVWVAWSETSGALRASQTYLAIAVVGGMALLVGLLMLWQLLGTLDFAAMTAAAAALPAERRPQLLAAGVFCLAGFGAKAGMFPLHIWLPKAHPVAPAPASALLSGILTKSGVFGVLVVSRCLLWEQPAWHELILCLGTVTMVLGAVLAVFSIDLKRTLACSSMSQIGFILVGVAMQGYLGEHNALAAWGTVLHMVNHALIKLLLFVAAGIIYLGNHHSLDLNEIRGWGRNKPWLKTIFFLGAASIAGIPGFSGYVSKTLLHEGIVEYIHHLEELGRAAGAFRAVEWLFLISGGLTAAYMTKLFVCIFVESRPAEHTLGVQEYVSRPTLWGLTAAAVLMGLLGLTPNTAMEPLAIFAGTFLRAGEGHAVHYFVWANLKGACISLSIGAAVYLLFIRTVLRRGRGEQAVYVDLWPKWLDLENLVYRPGLRALSFLGAVCARTAASVGDWLVLLGEKLLFTRAPGIFVPGKTENFGAYAKEPRRSIVTDTFSFDLLLACVGLLATLLYILFK